MSTLSANVQRSCGPVAAACTRMFDVGYTLGLTEHTDVSTCRYIIRDWTRCCFQNWLPLVTAETRSTSAACVTMYRVNTAVVGTLLALLKTVANNNNYPPHVSLSFLLFVRMEKSQSHRKYLLQIIFGFYVKISRWIRTYVYRTFSQSITYTRI